jgi:hypothetical protein
VIGSTRGLYVSGRLEVRLRPNQGDRIDQEDYDKWRRALQAESTDAAGCPDSATVP